MRYLDSLRDFFKAPQWGMNMLFGAICIFIPIVGQLVLSGWAITALWSRGDDADPTTTPPFDFKHFVKYLLRGLWPFLASLLATLLFMVVIFAFLLIAVAAGVALQSQLGDGAFIKLIVVLGFLVYLMLLIGMQLFLIPVMVAATVTQDLTQAFNRRFIAAFIRTTWLDMVMVTLFLMLLGMALIIPMIITLYIGAFAAAPVISYCWHHLQKQLYLLYLERGGDPLPRSPKLSDLPPPLPNAPA